jgi:hypothetical protein
MPKESVNLFSKVIALFMLLLAMSENDIWENLVVCIVCFVPL